jgi:TRAP-type transport system small permease protein
MRTAERIFVEANKWALILILAAMSAIVFANVTLRYTTNFSIVWAEEVARYLMVWMTFLGAGLALRTGGLVAITNLHDALSATPQRVMRLIVVLGLLAFFALMIWVGYSYALRMRFQMTPATRIPFSAIYAAMPIGFALMTVHLLLIARRLVRDNAFDRIAGVDENSAAGG